VKEREPTWQPKVLDRISIFSGRTLIGIIIDLEKFTCNPVEVAKELRSAFRQNNYFASAFRIIRVSSAY